MDVQHPRKPNSLYPDIHSEEQLYHSHQNHAPSGSVSLYPTVQMENIVKNPPGNDHGKGYPLYGEDKVPEASNYSPCAQMEATEEILIRIPGVVVHLIDKEDSMELGSGDFMLVRLVQGENTIAVFARVENQIQWPLVKDEAAVKLDDCHYFFSLREPKAAHDSDDDDHHPNPNCKPSSSSRETDAGDNLLNYGLTFAAQGQAFALKELDKYLEQYSCFSVQRVSNNFGESDVLGDTLAKETSPREISGDKKKKKLVAERSAAYWTTIAPNVEDYSGCVAKAIAAGSGQVIRGILWCGDVTADRLRWGNEFLKKRLQPSKKPSEISPKAMKRMRRAKRVSKMSEKVAVGVLAGVVKVVGVATESVVTSKAGKKFFSLMPGEVVLASLDAFGKTFDAVEVAGKNVLRTSSVVTTGIVSHRYGEQAAEFTNEGLGAAGHTISTAWTISKIRNAITPKKALKPSALAKSAVKTAAKAAKKEKRSK